MSIILAIAVLAWFYLTAKKCGEEPIKWVVIGMIGYWVACWGIKLTLVNALLGSIAKAGISKLVVTQVPALAGVGAAFLIRKKLLADAGKNG